MMVKVKLRRKGRIRCPHQTFSHTATIVFAGVNLNLNINGEKKIVEAGDGVYIEPKSIA